MMKRFNMVIGERHNETTLPPGDEIDQAMSAPQAEPATRENITTPVMLRLDSVRSFNPRKPDAYGNARKGTRITFADGGGFAVDEDFETVAAAFTQH